jgi:hypothetical protein
VIKVIPELPNGELDLSKLEEMLQEKVRIALLEVGNMGSLVKSFGHIASIKYNSC